MQKISLHFKVFVAFSLLMLLFSQDLAAQSKPELTIKLSKDSILIGDQVDLIMTIKKDITQVVGIPTIDSEASKGVVENIGEMVVDTLDVKDREVTLEVRQKMTSFEAGNYTFPAMPLPYLDKNITDTVYSDSLVLFVDTYLIDTATYVMADIKPQIDEPFTMNELKFYLRDIFSSIYTYIGIFIVAVMALIYWLIKRRKRRNAYVRPDEPPHVTAIRSLESVAHQRLWENGKFKDYYTALSDILRIYIRGRYDINGMEMTSQEILDALKSAQIDERDMNRLRDLLLLSDFVKFAKAQPSSDECIDSYDNAYYFVEDTKLMPLEVDTDNEINVIKTETESDSLTDSSNKENNSTDKDTGNSENS